MLYASSLPFFQVSIPTEIGLLSSFIGNWKCVASTTRPKAFSDHSSFDVDCGKTSMRHLIYCEEGNMCLKYSGSGLSSRVRFPLTPVFSAHVQWTSNLIQ